MSSIEFKENFEELCICCSLIRAFDMCRHHMQNSDFEASPFKKVPRRAGPELRGLVPNLRLTLLRTGFVLQTTNDIISGSGTSRGSWERTAIFNTNEFAALRDHPGITGRQPRTTAAAVGSRTTGATSRGSGTTYSSGGIGWIDSEDQPGRVGGTEPTSAQQHGSGSYDGGTGRLTHREYASSTGTTRKGCRDGCRREEDDSGSGTRRRIGFTQAVSRGEVEAIARTPLEVGGLQERVADANNDASAVRRWSAEYAGAPCGGPQGVRGRLGRSGGKVMGADRARDRRARRAQRLRRRFCRRDGDVLRDAARTATWRQHRLADAGYGSSGAHRLARRWAGWIGSAGRMDGTGMADFGLLREGVC
ncbi:hypothetical protein B0H14DRAFT_3686424 [Mycena olivaceomarginata]|nr:hypothetical protein B0H14DRAFT_3686424 [Mycena olivaceomarginata]